MNMNELKEKKVSYLLNSMEDGTNIDVFDSLKKVNEEACNWSQIMKVEVGKEIVKYDTKGNSDSNYRTLSIWENGKRLKDN